MINKDNFIANLYSVIYLINVKDIAILMYFFLKNLSLLLNNFIYCVLMLRALTKFDKNNFSYFSLF